MNGRISMDNRLLEGLDRYVRSLCEDLLDDYVDELADKYDKRRSGEEQPVTYCCNSNEMVYACGIKKGRQATKSQWDNFYKWLDEVQSEYDIVIDFLEENRKYVGITGYKEDVLQFIHDYDIQGTEPYVEWDTDDKNNESLEEGKILDTVKKVFNVGKDVVNTISTNTKDRMEDPASNMNTDYDDYMKNKDEFDKWKEQQKQQKRQQGIWTDQPYLIYDRTSDDTLRGNI